MSKNVDVIAEMSATVLHVKASAGSRVSEGDELVILESMKMEIPVAAPCAGVVSAVNVDVEQVVQDGDVLVVITVEP